MSPEPIEQEATSPEPKGNTSSGDKTTLWTDPKNLPAAVEGIYKAAFNLSSPMQDFEGLSPVEFGDVVFQLRNYHADMDGSRGDASNDCETLAESLTTSLNIYRVTDADGGAAVSNQGGMPSPVPEVAAPPLTLQMPAPDIQGPVTVMPTH